MSELEKMQTAQWYFATDKTLAKQRQKAKSLCFEYNQLSDEHQGRRKQLLKKLLPNVKGAWIEPQFYCDYGYNIHATGGLFINHHVTILDGALVEIGSNAFIGPHTVIATTSHHMDPQQRARGLCRSKKIIIGNNVWIGANVSIIGGAVIADNEIVPAGSVVR